MTALSRRIVTAATLLVAFLPVGTSRAQAVDPARLVQRNIDGALAMLSDRDVSTLTHEQRAKRAWVVAELTRYQAAREFPENRHFAGDNVPYFVDQTSGAVCAVGHLMAASGHRELVDRIVAEDNNVWVLELAADAEVGAWLEEHGLTLSEAARIQMPYPGDGGVLQTTVASAVETRRLVGAAGLATAGLLLNSFAKPGAESRGRARLGVAAGLLAMGYGFRALDEPSGGKLAASSLALGGLSLIASSNTYTRLRANERMRVAPIVPMGRESGAGLSLSLTF